MPTRLPIRSLLAAAVVVTAAPAFAQVSWEDDVFPTFTTDFGVPIVFPPGLPGFPDGDNDGEVDFIFPAGNNLDTADIDPFDPTAAAGVDGLAWDDPFVWRAYENAQNILVGQTERGELNIGAGGELRFQHLVLGGPGMMDVDLNPAPFNFTAGVELVADAPDPDFDFDMAAGASDSPTSGLGIVNITGGTYNNDPQDISGGLLNVLIAAGGGGPTPVQNFFQNGSPDEGARPTGPMNDFGYDVHVGLTGSGVLTVSSGGALVVQDMLSVGYGETGSGQVVVDGLGSILNAKGRSEFDLNNAESMLTSDYASIIGGLGTGTLSVTNGGQAIFNNGLSLGASNAMAISGPAGAVGDGTVLVQDAGSRIDVNGSAAMSSPSNLDGVALAIGELRDVTTDGGAVSTLGAGRLEIGLGATVDVGFSPSNDSANNLVNANAEIGRAGSLTMRGGQLLVGNDVINDGAIDGYGFLRAATFVNTAVATLDGNAVEGPLELLINSDDENPLTLVGVTETFLNLGTITGAIDITVNGAFANGSTDGSGSAAPGSTGGAIRATGRIEAATFFNRAEAEVSVGQGDSLSILAVGGAAPLTDANIVVGDGSQTPTPVGSPEIGDIPTVQPFVQANLGDISVSGGTLEVGVVLTTGADSLLAADNFINARVITMDDPMTNAIEEQIVGTINSDDGTLIFQTGLLNTGVVAFTGGDNEVYGAVTNAFAIDYDSDRGIGAGATDAVPGVMLLSGDETTVTFHDQVINEGFLSVGPGGTVANFLGGLSIVGGSTLQIAVADPAGTGANPSSFAVNVGAEVVFEQGNGTTIIDVPFLTAGPVDTGTVIPLLTFGEIVVDGGATVMMESLAADQVAGLSVIDGVLNAVVVDSSTGAFMLGDANGNGVIDAGDYSLLRDSLGLAVAAGTAGDFNSNGFVDNDDLATLRLNYGLAIPSGPLAIPEPTTAALALLAAAAAAGRRRRA